MSEAIFGFIGVLVGAIIPWIQTYFRERRSRQDDANYLAIKVVTILEKYILNCIDVVYDDGTALGQPAGRDASREPQVQSPPNIVFPDDINWKSIDAKLMFELLSLPNIAHEADRTISFAAEHASPPDYEEIFHERQKQYAKIGLYALNVETKIREKYKISNPTEESDWNPRDVLTEKISEVEQRIKRYEQNNLMP